MQQQIFTPNEDAATFQHGTEECNDDTPEGAALLQHGNESSEDEMPAAVLGRVPSGSARL